MGLYVSQVSQNEDSIYEAIAYYRLSKDDGKNHESDSIANQRVLIREYVKNHPNIRLIDEAFDDGYTGTNYDRPGFQKVMDAVNNGTVNCVIVKDLSRLGREYVETGKYLEMVFPSMGIRFIAINDDVDSSNAKAGDDILVPVKNIMNETYCRELSKKLRRQFRIQRSKGEYLGAFACYGYRKSPEDKHKLVIDEYAAEIVRAIFVLKLKGYSQQSIADYLNSEAVLPPAEYKKSQGLNYKSGLKGSGQAQWRAYTVQNILTNPVYIGVLVQGKRGTPNYKVKQMRVRDEEQWCVIKDNHEAVIDEYTFESVQRILSRDTRVAPKADAVNPLSGLIFCADCGRSMIKRSVSRGNKKFFYYVCSTNKKGQGCSSHTIPVEKLEDTVMRAIKNQINLVVEMKQLLEEVNHSEILSVKLKRFDLLIAEKNKEIDKQKDFRMKLYEALSDGLIERDEYDIMRKRASDSIEAGEAAVQKLEEERAEVISKSARNLTWLEQFARYQSYAKLSREIAVALIDRVTVYEDKTVHIDFNYRDEIASYQEILKTISQEVG
jgi:site-specific DNA recombinase